MYLSYIRKSRADDSSITVQEVLERHETILQEYAKKTFGYKIPEQNIYREIVSGETIQDRPEMQKVLEFITNNDVTGVLVVEPQRLSRGDLMDCGQIMRVFKYSNTKVITPQKTFDLNDKYDYKFLSMELTQGNEYLEYTKMILKRGQEAARQKGCYLGSRRPYGYDKIKINKLPTLTPNEIETPVVKLIYDLFIKGYGSEQICNELHKRNIKPPRSKFWSKETIKKILSNELYIGKITHGKKAYFKTVDDKGNIKTSRPVSKDYEIIDGLHPAIIDEETFNQAQIRIGRLSREPAVKELKNAYAGILKCSCGSSCSRQEYNGYTYLYCRHRKYCHSPSIKYDEFTKLLISRLKTLIADFSVEVNNDNTDNEKTLLKAFKTELQALETQQTKLYDLLEKGIYTEQLFIKRNKALEKERQRLQDAIAQTEKNATKKERNNAFTITLHAAIDTLADERISAKSKNTFLKSFISKIVYDGDIHIDFL